MGKVSLSKSLSKMFLGELSKVSILSIFGALNLPTLFLLYLGQAIETTKKLFLLPIIKWQLSEYLLGSSFILSCFFFTVLLTIKIHKHITSKRKFFHFENEGYLWKMLVPERKIDSPIPLCPKHRVSLSVSIPEHVKCQFCNTQIRFLDRWHYYDNARAKGIAILDGLYKD
jgi:hypothetical protein